MRSGANSRDAVTVRLAPRLRVREVVNDSDLLDKLACDIAAQLFARQPERRVLSAPRAEGDAGHGGALASKKSFSKYPSGSQNVMSLKTGGYFEYGLKVVISPARNCFEKRSSSVQKRRMSGMEKRTIASRSSPSPNAQPWRLSWPARSSTPVWITPQPSTSSQSPW